MQMSFYWTTEIGDFFFPGLTVNTTGPFVSLCIVLFLLSIVYEAMKIHSSSVRARAARERLRASSCAPSETANLIAIERRRGCGPLGGGAASGDGVGFGAYCTPRTWRALGEAAVFLLHNTLGYALMLSVMVFNGYLFVVVVFGMGLGYFLFGHVAMRINMENMQARTTKVICSPVCPDDQPNSSTAFRPHTDHMEHLNQSHQQQQNAATVMQHQPELHHYPNYQSTSASPCHSRQTKQPQASSPTSSTSSSSSKCDDHNNSTTSRSHILDSCRL